VNDSMKGEDMVDNKNPIEINLLAEKIILCQRSNLRNVGQACVTHGAHGTDNWERRFSIGNLDYEWQDNWGIFKNYMPSGQP